MPTGCDRGFRHFLLPAYPGNCAILLGCSLCLGSLSEAFILLLERSEKDWSKIHIETLIRAFSTRNFSSLELKRSLAFGILQKQTELFPNPSFEEYGCLAE